MALIVVFATLAILATSVTEYVYNTRVNLHLAQNQRDEVKAYFLARSGINLQRLALGYQAELESQGGAIGNSIQRSNFQLWQYLDLLLPTFSSGSLSASEYGEVDLQSVGATGFGSVQGSIEFNRPIPEEGKINVNAFASQRLDEVTLQAFCALLRPTQYDDLLGSQRDRELQSRFEVIAAIIDHIDPDSDTTIINEDCVITGGGLGNEINRYREVDWGPKNEPLVTLDELLLVPGVTDAFMRQFRDNLTVYPVPGEFYVNLQDAQGFAGFLCSHIISTVGVNPCTLPQIAEQVNFLALALEGWNRFFSNPFNVLSLWLGGSMSAEDLAGAAGNGQMMAFRTERDFLGVLNTFMQNQELALYFMSFADPQRAQLFGFYMAMGANLAPANLGIVFDDAAMLRRISVDVPRVFTVEATGVYGGASRSIRTVVDYRNEGRLLYWREF